MPLIQFTVTKIMFLNSTKCTKIGGWAVFLAGLTPFPYKIITIASGMAQLNLALFIGLSVYHGFRFLWFHSFIILGIKLEPC